MIICFATTGPHDFEVVAGASRSDYVFIRKCVEFMRKNLQFDSQNPACIREFNEAPADVNECCYPFPEPAWQPAMLEEEDMCEQVSNEVHSAYVTTTYSSYKRRGGVQYFFHRTHLFYCLKPTTNPPIRWYQKCRGRR